MRKSIKIFLLLAISFAILSCTAVSKAATEDDIINFMSKPFVIAGQTTYIPNEYVKEAKRYLSTHDVTSEQADAIIAKAQEGVSILQKEGQSDAKKLSKAKKEEILSKFQEAVAVVGAKATYANGKIIVSDENNKTFGAYPVEMITKKTFMQTGADNTMLYVMSGIVAVAVITAIAYRRKISAEK